MEFVSLIVPGGNLWQAWVACHYERRLKRRDDDTVDIKDMCSTVLHRLGGIPIRVIGHLMLGIVRLLLRQVNALEGEVEEARDALMTSLSSGSRLPTVPKVSVSQVTLRHHPEEVPSLDLAGPGTPLNMLMEPELPAVEEVEASLQEGRRHVAPLALITLSPDREPADVPVMTIEDDFGAPSAADLASMEAVVNAALLQQEDAERLAGIPSGDNHPVAAPSAADLPPVDFLLGEADSQKGLSPPEENILPLNDDVLMEGMETPPAPMPSPEAEAIEPAWGDAGALPAVDSPLGRELVTPSPQRVVRTLDFDTPVLSERAAREHGPTPAAQRPDFLAQVMAMSPPRPSPPAKAAAGAIADGDPACPAQVVAQEPPIKKRRRKPNWLDDKNTIDEKKYNNTKNITLAKIYEYGIFLPHRSAETGLTTTLSDACPLLLDPLLRAPKIAAKRRMERARAAEAQAAGQEDVHRGDPEADPGLATSPDVAPVDDSDQPPPTLMDTETPPNLPSPPLPPPASPPESQQCVASDVEPFIEPLASETEVDLPRHSDAEAEASEAELHRASDAEGRFSDTDAEAYSGPRELPTHESLDHLGSAIVASEQMDASEAHVDAQGATAVVVPGPDNCSSMPPPPPKKSRWQSEALVDTPPSNSAMAVEHVKVEEGESVDYATISVKQGCQLRESLNAARDEDALSFLQLVDSDHNSAEAAACRFVDLLSLHMGGVVSLKQEEPYADISISKGRTFEAWSDDYDRRGVKREASDHGADMH
eukprot:TRINITY_DN24098_c0_g1_i1.p1 TRINITY_DN24098_c0_g1~~TRINITY_DN24098_c0_g1_i1.p1  ORF type:complete len:765 (-),score=148.47 TRINITY_DN24098_c0_g1_i1:69-2363(-)